MSSLVEFKSFYAGTFPSRVGTMTATAAVDDVLVVACVDGTTSSTPRSATVTGATVTLAQQEHKFNNVGGNQNITILTGVVTAAGVPVITTSGGTDPGAMAWIVRGLSSATKNAGNSAGGTGVNPLVSGSVTTTVTTALIIAFNNETAVTFSSFTGSITTDGNETTHTHAGGHEFGVAAGTYTPGVNCSTGAANTMAFIYLPETSASTIAIPSRFINQAINRAARF